MVSVSRTGVVIIYETSVDVHARNMLEETLGLIRAVRVCKVQCEKYLQHQQDLYHVFIDFKKTFDRVWHAALRETMKKYNISTNLFQVIKNLYNKATSAVLFNGSIGDWFRTTIGVRQGCLLSPTLFNIFLERIMKDA